MDVRFIFCVYVNACFSKVFTRYEKGDFLFIRTWPRNSPSQTYAFIFPILCVRTVRMSPRETFLRFTLWENLIFWATLFFSPVCFSLSSLIYLYWASLCRISFFFLCNDDNELPLDESESDNDKYGDFFLFFLFLP